MPLKYEIDPWNESIQGTICATLRAIWRKADATGDDEVKDLTAIAFDKANRMDRALHKYRKRFLQLPQELQNELHHITGEE
jgi:hypothetical protein